MPMDVARTFHLRSEELGLFTAAMRTQITEFADHAVDAASLFDAASQASFGHGKLPSLTSVADQPLSIS